MANIRHSLLVCRVYCFVGRRRWGISCSLVVVYFVSIVAFIMSISSVLGMDYVFSHFQNTGLLFGMSFILLLAMFLPLVLTGVLVGSSLVFSLGALGIL